MGSWGVGQIAADAEIGDGRRSIQIHLNFFYLPPIDHNAGQRVETLRHKKRTFHASACIIGENCNVFLNVQKCDFQHFVHWDVERESDNTFITRLRHSFVAVLNNQDVAKFSIGKAGCPISIRNRVFSVEQASSPLQ
jgi:hypothetical protein